jgi:hypothetical protein
MLDCLEGALWATVTGTALGTCTNLVSNNIALGFTMPYFGSSFTSVSVSMHYGFSLGGLFDTNNRVVYNYYQATITNSGLGNTVYNTAPLAADLVKLSNLTRNAFSTSGCFKFSATNGLVVTYDRLMGQVSVQLAIITDGVHTFLLMIYDSITIPGGLTSGYSGGGTNPTFVPSSNNAYYYKVNGPALSSINIQLFFCFFKLMFFFNSNKLATET